MSIQHRVVNKQLLLQVISSLPNDEIDKALIDFIYSKYGKDDLRD